MRVRLLLAAALTAGLGACAAIVGTQRAPVDPATCGARDFNVYFDDDSTQLNAEARAVIDTIGDGLAGCRIDAVRIIGAADAEGPAPLNEALSETRAKVLADYLEDELDWPRKAMTLGARGERGAVTDEGLAVPMRRRARVVVEASAP